MSVLGSEKEEAVYVRILAATNRDIRAMMKAGEFRADLSYRLNAVSLHIPPLRERPEDIESIVWNCLGRPPTVVELTAFSGYSWPGNIRELTSVLDRARILHDGNLLAAIPQGETIHEGALDESLDAAIRAHVRNVHNPHGQNNTRAAKALKISINTLKKYLLPCKGE